MAYQTNGLSLFIVVVVVFFFYDCNTVSYSVSRKESRSQELEVLEKNEREKGNRRYYIVRVTYNSGIGSKNYEQIVW